MDIPQCISSLKNYDMLDSQDFLERKKIKDYNDSHPGLYFLDLQGKVEISTR